jgi:hypothetical protein
MLAVTHQGTEHDIRKDGHFHDKLLRYEDKLIQVLMYVLPVAVEAGLKTLYCCRTLPAPCLVCACRCVHFPSAETLRFLILMVEVAKDHIKM